MMLATETKTDMYPAATMETANASTEEAVYTNLPATRVAKPAGYPEDTYTPTNDFVALVRGDGQRIGPSKLLKVMAGDQFSFRVSSWYRLNGTTPSAPNSLLTNLVNVLATAIGGLPATKGSFSDLTSTNALNPGATSFVNTQSSYTTSRPKAFVNWVLLDEQFKYVSNGSGFEQVGADNAFTVHIRNNLNISKSGYLYIYVSNETPNVSVFFDNLQVTHIRGPLLEETHYYPFGLVMAGLSSRALSTSPENQTKYNGIEFLPDLEVNTYDAFYRELDGQIGKWWQIDPVTDGYEAFSPYASNYDNPITYSDPLGDEGGDEKKSSGCCQWLKDAADFAGGFVTGTALGLIDNLTGTNIRGQVAPAFRGTGAAGHGWNMGLNTADAAGVVIAAGEIISGGTGMAGAGGATLATAGAATPLTLPVATGSAALAAHGVYTGTNSINNLVNQNGRVNASSSSSNSSSGNSTKPRNAPEYNGTPNSSKIEAKDNTGKTTKYSTYGSNGVIKKQVQVSNGSARHGKTGATKKVPRYNINPQTGEKHMNGYEMKKAMPAETPPGKN